MFIEMCKDIFFFYIYNLIYTYIAILHQFTRARAREKKIFNNSLI